MEGANSKQERNTHSWIFIRLSASLFMLLLGLLLFLWARSAPSLQVLPAMGNIVPKCVIWDGATATVLRRSANFDASPLTDAAHIPNQSAWRVGNPEGASSISLGVFSSFEYEISIPLEPWSGEERPEELVLSPDEQIAIRRAVVAEMLAARELPQECAADLIAHGTFSGRLTSFSRPLISAVAVTGACLMVVSFVVVVAAFREWWKQRSGGCASCGYDLRGLPDGTPVCPECGNALRTSR